MTQSKHKLSARSVCLRSARRFGPVTVCWCSTLCANEWADDKWQTPCAVCICFSPINTTFILCVWGGIPMLKLALVCVGTYAGQLQCSYVHCCCSSSCLERSQRHSLTSPQTLCELVEGFQQATAHKKSLFTDWTICYESGRELRLPWELWRCSVSRKVSSHLCWDGNVCNEDKFLSR